MLLQFTEFIFCCSRSYLITCLLQSFFCSVSQSPFLFSFTKSVSVRFHKVGFCSVLQSLILFSFTKSVSVRFHKVCFCSVSQSLFLFSFTKSVSVQLHKVRFCSGFSVVWTRRWLPRRRRFRCQRVDPQERNHRRNLLNLSGSKNIYFQTTLSD